MHSVITCLDWLCVTQTDTGNARFDKTGSAGWPETLPPMAFPAGFDGKDCDQMTEQATIEPEPLDYGGIAMNLLAIVFLASGVALAMYLGAFP